MTASTGELEEEIARLERRLDELKDDNRELEQQLSDRDGRWKSLLDYAAGFEKPGFVAVYTVDTLRAQLAHWDAAKKPTLVAVAA